MHPSKFFTPEEKQRISAAVKDAEKNTSGEIRVHVDRFCKGDVLDRAAYVFEKLSIHKTALRNGVLFYLAVENRKFAILGDAGINAVTGENFWDQIKEVMTGKFREGLFVEGLVTGITMAGFQLKQHFPYQADDVNELPDDISFGGER